MMKTECAKCGAQFEITIREAESMTSFAEWYRKTLGSYYKPKPICNECLQFFADKERAEREQVRFSEHYTSGRCSRDFDKYLTPPTELEQKNPAAWCRIRAWRYGAGSLFVYGEEGVGKSSACRYLLARGIAEGVSALDLSAQTIEDESCQWGSKALLFTRATFTKLVLIDDIGNTIWTPRGLGQLRKILDARNNEGRETFITSNMTIKNLHAKLSRVVQDDVFVTSMLRRLSPVIEIEMRGESYRQTLQRRVPNQ